MLRTGSFSFADVVVVAAAAHDAHVTAVVVVVGAAMHHIDNFTRRKKFSIRSLETSNRHKLL